ncbi:MAG: hypothetical protein ACI3ZR_03830 [bacterium]
MLDLDNLEKRIIKKAGIIWLICLIEAAFSQHIAAIGGVFVGGLCNIFSFHHIVSTNYAICDSSQENLAKILTYTRKKYIFRLFLMLAVLCISWKGGRYFFGGTVLGLLVVKLAIIADVLIDLISAYVNRHLSKIKRR